MAVWMSHTLRQGFLVGTHLLQLLTWVTCVCSVWFVVMSFPGNRMEEVRDFLDRNHPEQYLVFNLSDKAYDTSILHGQVWDGIGTDLLW